MLYQRHISSSLCPTNFDLLLLSPSEQYSASNKLSQEIGTAFDFRDPDGRLEHPQELYASRKWTRPAHHGIEINTGGRSQLHST